MQCYTACTAESEYFHLILTRVGIDIEIQYQYWTEILKIYQSILKYGNFVKIFSWSLKMVEIFCISQHMPMYLGKKIILQIKYIDIDIGHFYIDIEI